MGTPIGGGGQNSVLASTGAVNTTNTGSGNLTSELTSIADQSAANTLAGAQANKVQQDAAALSGVIKNGAKIASDAFKNPGTIS